MTGFASFLTREKEFADFASCAVPRVALVAIRANDSTQLPISANDSAQVKKPANGFRTGRDSSKLILTGRNQGKRIDTSHKLGVTDSTQFTIPAISPSQVAIRANPASQITIRANRVQRCVAGGMTGALRSGRAASCPASRGKQWSVIEGFLVANWEDTVYYLIADHCVFYTVVRDEINIGNIPVNMPESPNHGPLFFMYPLRACTFVLDRNV